MTETENIRLSVIDIEKKYKCDDYEEQVYGPNTIVSYGKDNNAPVLYRNCYRNSATLKSIIDGTVNYILGDAVIVNDSAKIFAERVNRKGMTMRQLIANIALSYEMYGGFAVQVIYNKIGYPVELYPLDFARCRTNESGTSIFYSKKQWTKYQTKSDEYDCFNPENFNIEKPTQILYYKGDFTSNVYPLPPYYSAIRDVLTEIECANYSLNSVSNGFAARHIINIPDGMNLTNEQKELINTSIKEKFCGSDAESNFMLYFADGENKLEISKIEADDVPQQYINIKDNARTNIFIGMRATPILFGLPNATNGFSTNEYRDSYKLYDKNVVNPIRDIIIESIEKILGKGAVTIVPYKITFDEE